jgi:hypothetical protein
MVTDNGRLDKVHDMEIPRRNRRHESETVQRRRHGRSRRIIVNNLGADLKEILYQYRGVGY